MKNPIEDIADLDTHRDNESGGDCPAATCSPKIIQILIAPNDSTWQGRMMGLDSSGAVHSVNPEGRWEPFVPPLNFQENREMNRNREGAS